jgi:hypothetical protein
VNISNRLVAFSVTLAVLAALLIGVVAEAKPKVKPHYRHFVNEPRGCPVRQLADGSLVDCQGWRKWSGSVGWDNTCFNLDYLPSEFACGSKGSRR